MGDEELKTAPTQLLDQDIMAKTKAGPVRWGMVVTIDEPSNEQVTEKKSTWGVITLSVASS